MTVNAAFTLKQCASVKGGVKTESPFPDIPGKDKFPFWE